MIKKFYVFGNIGKMSETPKSGGQSSARRVIKGLEDMGYKMTPIVRRRCVMEGCLIHFLETQSFAVIDLCKIIGHIMFGNRRNSAFLMLTYGGKLAPYELIITSVVRMLGYKSVTYMKGGQFMDFYNRGSKFYRWIVKKNMDLQAQAWFEGMPSLEIVKKIIAVGPLVLGVLFSIEYMLWGSVCTSLIAYFLNSYYSADLINYPTKEQIKDILPTFLVSFVTAAAMWSLTLLSLSNWLLLPLQCSLGIALAVLIYECLHLPEYVEVKQLAFSILRRKKF